MLTENHDPLRPEGTSPQPTPKRDSESPGYETTDVNVGGVVVFLAGLGGFLLIFFVFCFVMGKVINNAFEKEDGPPNKWSNAATRMDGSQPSGGKRENLASATEMQQRQLQQMTSTFPTPRLETDDGDQSIADLHAREDLLLDNYSSDPASGGSIRIPIEHAMELIAQRGLPLAAQVQSATVAGSQTGNQPGNQENAPGQMAGDVVPTVTPPLTSGFARTGYELDTIEAREQKLSFAKGSANAQAELKPAH